MAWLPRLPQNLHFEVHEMLRLPQNEQLKVLKMLCQPRNHYVKALPEKYSQKEHQNNLEKNRQPMAIGLKAIASRVEAISSRVEAMAIRLEAIASVVACFPEPLQRLGAEERASFGAGPCMACWAQLVMQYYARYV